MYENASYFIKQGQSTVSPFYFILKSIDSKLLETALSLPEATKRKTSMGPKQTNKEQFSSMNLSLEPIGDLLLMKWPWRSLTNTSRYLRCHLHPRQIYLFWNFPKCCPNANPHTVLCFCKYNLISLITSYPVFEHIYSSSPLVISTFFSTVQNLQFIIVLLEKFWQIQNLSSSKGLCVRTIHLKWKFVLKHHIDCRSLRFSSSEEECHWNQHKPVN